MRRGCGWWHKSGFSTARQGASGPGIEAQHKVLEDFAVSGGGAEVVSRFNEGREPAEGRTAGTGQDASPGEGSRPW